MSVWLASAEAASAQVACAPAAQPPDSVSTPSRPPDLLIRASVSARSVRFERSPSVRTTMLGCAGWDSVVVTERVNLPDPVEPGVTYRDVRIGVEIRSWLDLRCDAPSDPSAAADSVPARPIDPCALILGADSTPAIPREP